MASTGVAADELLDRGRGRDAPGEIPYPGGRLTQHVWPDSEQAGQGVHGQLHGELAHLCRFAGRVQLRREMVRPPAGVLAHRGLDPCGRRRHGGLYRRVRRPVPHAHESPEDRPTRRAQQWSRYRLSRRADQTQRIGEDGRHRGGAARDPEPQRVVAGEGALRDETRVVGIRIGVRRRGDRIVRVTGGRRRSHHVASAENKSAHAATRRPCHVGPSRTNFHSGFPSTSRRLART